MTRLRLVAACAAAVLLALLQDPGNLAARVAELEHRVGEIENARRPIPVVAGSEFADSDKIRRKLLSDGIVANFVGSTGKIDQMRPVAAGMRKALAGEHRALRGSLPATEPAAQRILFEAYELNKQINDLPRRYDHVDPIQRIEARGRLLIHLMTLEGLAVPESVADLWKWRKASVESSAVALGHPLGSKEEEAAWAEAGRLLEKSKGLEDELRR